MAWRPVVLNLVVGLGFLRAVHAEEVCDGHHATSSNLLQHDHVRVVLASAAEDGESGAGNSSFSTNATNGSSIVDRVDACLRQRMSREGDPERLRRWELVREAEITTRLARAGVQMREWPIDPEVIQAFQVAGEQAAESIVREEFARTRMATLSNANLSQSAIQRFAAAVEKMEAMCGHEAVEENADVAHTQGRSKESSGLAEISAYAAGLCKSEALDPNFFMDHFGSAEDCSEMISSSRLVQLNKFARKLEYIAKAALVLHDAENQLGHHFKQHFQSQSSFTQMSTSSSQPMADAVLRHAKSRPRMARLRYLDQVYYEDVYGFSTNAYCQSNFRNKREDPEHWVSQSEEIQAYVQCLCVDHNPSLLCDTLHAEPLERIRPHVHRRMRGDGFGGGDGWSDAWSNTTQGQGGFASQGSSQGSSLVELAAEQSGQSAAAATLGPCGADMAKGIPGPVPNCRVTVNGKVIEKQVFAAALSNFQVIQDWVDDPEVCLGGFCAPCMGIKPNDPIKFMLDLGFDGVCSSGVTSSMAKFHMYAKLQICIGGALGEIAKAIGYGRVCRELGRIQYFLFINKMRIHSNLPIPLPPPLGVRAELESNLNLGDISRATREYCGLLGSREYQCLKGFYDARGPTETTITADLLIGIKIDFIFYTLEIGKWVQVYKYHTVEHHNSRELAMNTAGITFVHIGPSSEPDKCGHTWSGVNCHSASGDKGHRANEDHAGASDDFRVYRPYHRRRGNTRALCVRRTDKAEGWGMNLELPCKTDNSALNIIVPIGPSPHSNHKCWLPDEPVRCDSDSGTRRNRLGFDDHADEFQVYSTSGGRWCARRTDANSGWALDLALDCKPTDEVVDWKTKTIHFGPSETKKRCLMVEEALECDPDAGDPHKRANRDQNGDTFFISVSEDGFVCADRTDANLGWGMDLKIHCKARDKARKRVDVHFGSSDYRMKCIPFHGLLDCPGYAGNPEYRLKETQHGDTFMTYWARGEDDLPVNEVCVVRTDDREDWRSGWGLDLVFSCYGK